MPSRPVTLQARQGLSQAESQQKPDTQKPDAHSALVWQDCSGLRPQRPPAWHGVPAQSASATQWSRHRAVAGSQAYGAQSCLEVGRQSPFPSHAMYSTVLPSHEPGPQGDPAGTMLHAPAPSQVPSKRQALEVKRVHANEAGGGCPAGTGRQVPAEPNSWQLEHEDSHAVSQQMRSVALVIFLTQNPLAQSPGDVQSAPFGNGGGT